MTRRARLIATLTSASLFALILASPLEASGSGGGSMPSASAPSYDPAEEYRNGVDALQAQKFADAKKAFDRVLSAAPTDPNANYMAGLARAGLEDWKGAKRYFEKAVKYDGNLIPAHQQLGVTYAKLGDKAKAQTELDLLTERAKTCAGTCPQAADLSAATQAISAALGAGPQARIDTRPGLIFASTKAGDGAYLQAVSLINEKRYQDAITALEAATRSFGPHPDILTYLGFANRKLGRYAIAEGYYRQALAAAPGHRGATEYYGELMVERGDMAGARQMLAQLDAACAFGCAEAEELRGWIAAGRAPAS